MGKGIKKYSKSEQVNEEITIAKVGKIIDDVLQYMPDGEPRRAIIWDLNVVRQNTITNIKMEYDHHMNTQLKTILWKLFNSWHKGEPYYKANRGIAGEYTNISKEAYWLLAEQVIETEEDEKLRGKWKITPKGIAFILGRISIPRTAILKNGIVIGFHNEDIYEKDVENDKSKSGVQIYDDFRNQCLGYQERVRARGDMQGDLFSSVR